MVLLKGQGATSGDGFFLVESGGSSEHHMDREEKYLSFLVFILLIMPPGINHRFSNLRN
jgi:hypothetical protein